MPELRRQLASLESELCSNQVAANATFSGWADMRHRRYIEALASAGVWWHKHVPIPYIRVAPLKLICLCLVFYWRVFGMDD